MDSEWETGHLAYVAWQRGTMVDVIPLLDQMDADMADVPRQTIYAAKAMAHPDADQLDKARHHLSELANNGFDFPIDQLWTLAMVYWAEAAIECRDARYAGLLFDHLAPWADQWSSSSSASQGPISHYLGGLATVLGRYGEGDTYFAQAAASNARAGAKFFAARTDLSWGRMLAARKGPGDTERGRRLLTQAHRAAAAHGYATVQRRAAAALQALAESRRRVPGPCGHVPAGWLGDELAWCKSVWSPLGSPSAGHWGAPGSARRSPVPSRC